MPDVTILIPAFNAGHLVGTAIRSALAQSYGDIEILVVDDGSSDDTAAQAHSFGNPVRVLKVPHGGLASARNHGMRAAAGRFIVFLDADDALEVSLVAQAVDFLKRDPDLAFVFCNVSAIYPDGTRTPQCIPSAAFAGKTEAVVKNPLVEVLDAGYSISSSGLCARREVLLEAGYFDETLWGSEDFEYWSRLYLRRPVGYLAEPLACLRRHEGNMTLQAERMIHSMAASREKVIRNCLKNGRFDLVPTVRRFARRHMSSAARDVLMGGDSAGARRLLWRYRRELWGPRWLMLMAVSLCPTRVLRAAARIRSRLLGRRG
jgi:glycosyltransferase involved in cell wall biosynthesis